MNHSEAVPGRKAFGAAAAVLILSFLLFSAFFIASEAGHRCQDETCPVCRTLEQCSSLLGRIGTGAPFESVILLPVFIPVLTVSFSLFERTARTPVSEKVRLNP